MSSTKKIQEQLIEQLSELNRFLAGDQEFCSPELSAAGISVQEVRILFEVNQNPGCTVKRLSELLDTDKGNLSRRLKKLEQSGYLRRFVVEEDRRMQVMILTRKGKTLAVRLELERKKRMTEALGNLTEAEYRELMKAMEVVMRILPRMQVSDYIEDV